MFDRPLAPSHTGTKSTTLRRAPDNSYLEITINAFVFGSMPRKGLSMMLGTVPKMVMEVGLTIEGRADDELPEQVVRGARPQSFFPTGQQHLTLSL